MKIEVNDKDKFLMVWLTNDESEDQKLRERLEPICDEYREKKYRVAFFQSGKRDLLDCTTGLLLHNQKVFAKRDLEIAKQKQTELEEAETSSQGITLTM